jgi:FdhD protein
LRNQRLVQSVDDIESITVDWEVGAAAVKTRRGIDLIVRRDQMKNTIASLLKYYRR